MSGQEVNSQAKSSPDKENKSYKKFVRVWVNLFIWSLAWFILVPFANFLGWGSEVYARSLKSLTDIWPIAILVGTLLLLLFIDWLRARSERFKFIELDWINVPHIMNDAAGLLITAGSMIFIVSDLYYHNLIPLVVISPVLWCAGLYFEDVAEKDRAQVNKH